MSILTHIAALALIALAGTQVTVQASEADRNRQINAECKASASSFNDGNGQTTALCQNAIYQKCLAKGLCPFYPEKCDELNRRVSVSCEPIRGLGAACEACNRFQ